MYEVKEIYKSEIEVKKSKFISFLVPINQFESLKEELKKKHIKANHIVYAFRELNEFNQIVERSSDDGEPKGAAGVPTLKVLRGKELINCAIITIRYFGGIKLGVGGMARAYAKAANSVIEVANIIAYEKESIKEFKISYKNQRAFEYLLKEQNIKNIKREFLEDKIIYKIKASKEKLKELITHTSSPFEQ